MLGIAILHVHFITALPVHATCIFSFAEATHLHTCRVLQYVEKHSLVSRWRRIGLVLQLTYDKLDVIQRDRDSVEDCAAAMLHQWLTSGGATKQALVDAVQEVK